MFWATILQVQDDIVPCLLCCNECFGAAGDSLSNRVLFKDISAQIGR